MLSIQIELEEWDEEKEVFIEQKIAELNLEHSLIAVSKWESKYHKPFLSNTEKLTAKEWLSYFEMMLLDGSDPSNLSLLTSEHVLAIKNYIDDSMTATWFRDSNKNKSRRREVITNEIIYYWMISLQIPFECQYWHLNRLLTLIRVCSEKNQPPKKMSQKQIMSRNAALNKARRAKHHSKG